VFENENGQKFVRYSETTFESEPAPDEAPTHDDVLVEPDYSTDPRYIRVETIVLNKINSGTSVKIDGRLQPVYLYVNNGKRSISYRLRTEGEEGLDHVVEQAQVPEQFPPKLIPADGFNRPGTEVRRSTASMLRDVPSSGASWFDSQVGVNRNHGVRRVWQDLAEREQQ
jgi:hypothetical protein